MFSNACPEGVLVENLSRIADDLHMQLGQHSSERRAGRVRVSGPGHYGRRVFECERRRQQRQKESEFGHRRRR
jgi:hypothetical protein